MNPWVNLYHQSRRISGTGFWFQEVELLLRQQEASAIRIGAVSRL